MPDELSVGIGGDQAERRGFHYFQTYVSPQLTSELHSVFWERLILQASHADAVMRHAAIAFGSLGERFLINDVMTFDNEDANKLHNFACSQYYKAIKLLRQQLSSGEGRSVEFTLIACFIFICIEFLQGSESAVLTHLKSGIDIIRRSDLHGARFDPNTTVSLMESVDFGYHVAIIFALLDGSAANWMAAPSFGMPTPVIPYSDYRSLVSEGFPNIDEADEYLSDIYARLYPVLPSRAKTHVQYCPVFSKKKRGFSIQPAPMSPTSSIVREISNLRNFFDWRTMQQNERLKLGSTTTIALWTKNMNGGNTDNSYK